MTNYIPDHYNKEEKPFQDLWEFHTVFGHPANPSPQFPDQKIRDLRINLIDEEFTELKEAEAANDMVEIADALADILYVVYGMGVCYGLPMSEIFNEVHASNMSKLGEDGKPIYREDGKILKGPNFFKPDIASILAKYQK